MRLANGIALILLLAVAACAPREGSTCDDGGAGGVVIDGVCL